MKTKHGSLSIKLNGSDDIYDFVYYKNSSLKERLIDENVKIVIENEPSLKKVYKKDPDDENFLETTCSHTWVYECKETGNKLVIKFSHYEDEEHEFIENEPNVDEIINSIMPIPFEYMVDKLNDNQNITVFISKIPYTATDYCIYHPNFEYDGHEPFVGGLFKYTECFKPGILQQISL